MNELKTITKTTILTLLCCAGVLGCSKKEEGQKTAERAGVALRASVTAPLEPLAAKGSINEGSNFVASVVGWESATAVDYTAAPAWQSTAAIAASPASSAIVLTPEQLYQTNTTIKTYMKAWYPATSSAVVGALVSFEGLPGDGTTDVLFADEVWGTAVHVPAPLVFAHPLTQLKFEVVGDADFVATGAALHSITIQGAELPSGLDLSAGAVTYGAPADLPLPNTGGQPLITTSPALFGSPVMVRPFAGNTFTVDIQTSTKSYSGVLVTIDADSRFVPGKAYTITLDFKLTDPIAVRSVVSRWEEGTDSGLVVD